MIIMGWTLHGHLAFTWGQITITSKWFSSQHRVVLLLPFARANCYPLHCQLSIVKQSCCIGISKEAKQAQRHHLAGAHPGGPFPLELSMFEVV